MHDGELRARVTARLRWRIGRLLSVCVAALVVLAGFAVAPAGATAVETVSGTGICFGFAGSGGCNAAFGGTDTAVAGSSQYFGAAFTATDGVATGELMVLDGSGTGVAFSDDPGSYQVNNESTLTGCAVSDVAVSDSSQEVFVTMPSSCSASAGQDVLVFANNTIVPDTPGPWSITLWTTSDPTLAGTNSLTLIAPPSPPQTPSASRNNRSVDVSWSAPATNNGSEVTGYNVYCADTAPSTSDTPSATTDASTTSVNIPGLSAHTTYTCIVTAVNAAGESTPSSPVSAVPYAPASAPRNLSNVRGDRSVTLFWDQPADFGGTPITAYHAYCSTTSPPAVEPANLCATFGPAKRSGVVRGLTNGVTYYIGITAVNAAGDSALSEVDGPTPAGPPSRPWAVRVKPERGALVVRWKVPTSDGGSAITDYSVYCFTDDPLSPGGTANKTVTTNSARLAGLSRGTLWHCTVGANNAVGSSRNSSVVSATTL